MSAGLWPRHRARQETRVRVLGVGGSRVAVGGSLPSVLPGHLH